MASKTFIEAFNKLQNAASEISKPTTSLEDSIDLFKEGMQEANFCLDILDKAEQEISVYQQEDYREDEINA